MRAKFIVIDEHGIERILTFTDQAAHELFKDLERSLNGSEPHGTILWELERHLKRHLPPE